MKERASALHFTVLLGVVALGHAALLPNVADPDGFYHVGHARAYLDGSLFDTTLPWATRSIIGDIGGDLWWGFHLLLLPFALLGSVPLAMQTAGVALTATLALSVRGTLNRLEVPASGLWAALLLVAVPNVFFRHLMVRPHVVSLAASLALASVLVRGRAWQVGLLSALTAWVHLSLAWIPPLIAVAYAIVRVPVTVVVGRDRPDTGVPIRWAVPAAIAGALAGWLLRPDAPEAARLLYVQLVELFAVQATELPLTFAAELTPIPLPEFARTSGSFAVAWLLTLVLAGRAAARGELKELGQARATFLGLSLALSTGFLAVALVSARRGLEQWVAFGVLGIAVAWMLPSLRDLATSRPVRLGLGLLLVAHLGWAADRHRRNVAGVAIPATTLEAVALHLAEVGEPGDLVFHARWDNFGPLFANNRVSRYLGGMDPIFQYAHDPGAYWEFFYLSADLTTEFTCDAYPCVEGVATDTHEVMTDHFGARWIVVQPYRNPRFTLYLLNDDRYALELETQTEAVFEVLRP